MSDLVFVLLGRRLGTYESVDILPESGFRIYSFEPGEGCALPKGDLFLDLGTGSARKVDGPTPETSFDILTCIGSCPKVTPEEFEAIAQAAEDFT
jgi:hypothetical protein